MSSVNPKLLIALAAVVVIAVFIKLNNPYREYSTQEYWKNATIASVQEIPDKALAPGNKNGSVLMWASMVVRNPAIIAALVERGADINESDTFFKGTPLSAAAAYNQNPDIIDELIRLGANINKKVSNNEDALMVAARYSQNPAIFERLVFHGANTNKKNSQGKTALDLANEFENKAAAQALERIIEDNS